MLSKDHKLDLRRQVAFFRTARRSLAKSYTLYWKKTSPKLLFQVIVAKGVVVNAVERNSLRRAVYDICAEMVNQYNTQQQSIVIVIRQKNSQEWLPELKQDIQKILDKNV